MTSWTPIGRARGGIVLSPADGSEPPSTSPASPEQLLQPLAAALAASRRALLAGAG